MSEPLKFDPKKMKLVKWHKDAPYVAGVTNIKLPTGIVIHSASISIGGQVVANLDSSQCKALKVITGDGVPFQTVLDVLNGKLDQLDGQQSFCE